MIRGDIRKVAVLRKRAGRSRALARDSNRLDAVMLLSGRRGGGSFVMLQLDELCPIMRPSLALDVAQVRSNDTIRGWISMELLCITLIL
jgi:hypothetical protein